MTLEKIRKEIDRIDTEIIDLLAQRSLFVDEAVKYKKDEQGVRDTGRVEKVISGVREKAEEAGLEPDLAERIYRGIIAAFIDQELNGFAERKKS